MTYQAPTTSLRPKSRPTTVDSSPRPPSRSSQPSTPKDNSSFGSFVSPTNTGSVGLASPTKPKKQEEKPSMVDRFWSMFDATGGTVSEDDTTSSSERALSFYDSVDMIIPEVPQVSEPSELAPATTDPYVGAVGTGNRDVAPNTMDAYLQGDTGIETVMPPASGLMTRPVQDPVQEDTDAAVAEAIGATTGVSDNEIPTNIDFDFIGEQEGYRSSMYVPKDKKGKVLDSSGPTVGTGVDIGQRSVKGLKGLPQGLVDKLTPYVGKKGQEASEYVKDNALTLTKSEVETINKWAKKQETDSLIKLWERDSDIAWDSLTKPQATAVASVMYQYGSKKVRTPSFWEAATSGDWDKAEAELRDFGDKYASRRIREANYLSGSN